MTWKILKSDHDYYSAMERLDKIFHPRNKAEQDEFDLLILLITKYEEENFGIEESDPIQVIKMKMKYMGLRQKDLIDCFGSKATTSKILSYKSPSLPKISTSLPFLAHLSRVLDFVIANTPSSS